MSVYIIVPNSVLPNFPAEDENASMELGKNHPSIRAKSRRPSWRNKIDAPSRIFSITLGGKRGGV